MSSRPSLSKSSMIAPPAWLKRLTPDQVADVAELADVELRLAEAIQRDQVPGIDLAGMLAEGHVGQVEQPADLEVVGKLLEVLGEMPDRQARALGVGVHGGGGDGQDARALAPAMDAVLVLAAAQGGHSLEVNDAEMPWPVQRRPILDPGSHLLQELVGPVWLRFIVETRGLHEERDDRLLSGSLFLGQALVDPVDEQMARSPERVADLLEGGRGMPGPERGEDRAEAAGIQRYLLPVCESRSDGVRRVGGPPGNSE